MITEDYVSFEIAKLLKEKGFMEGAIIKFFASGYDSKGNILNIRDTELKDYPRPTLQMAMKWLRYKKNLGIVVDMFFDDGILRYSCLVWQTVSPFELVAQPENIGSFNKHEEACEAAIKYCLENLI